MRATLPTAAIVLAALVAATFVFSSYHLFQLTMVVVYGIAILGMTVLTGINGQISLGHGAFYAIGAYTTGILMTSWNVPYWATLPVAAVICSLSAWNRAPVASASSGWSDPSPNTSGK